MKNILLLILLTFTFSNFIYSQQNESTRCGTTEYMEYLSRLHPEIMGNRAVIEEKITEYIDAVGRGDRSQQTVIVIPVVVHVIWNTTAQNISEQMVTSQIRVLNEDFRKMPGTNGWNTHPSGSDVRIEFRLADRDPNGVAHTGINRVYTTRTSFSYTTDNAYLKSLSYWPSDKYMNIWTANLSGGVLGYAQFPGGPAATDGVVILYNAFGFNSPYYPFNLGRTATHEVGHWVNLYHIWGDQNTCTGTDLCDDTPPCSGQYFSGYPSCPIPSQCGFPRQIQNYMDYSDDGCMNLYTNDQTSRMRGAWAVYRYNLLGSLKEKINVVQTGVEYAFTDVFTQNFAKATFNALGTTDSLTVEVFPNLTPLSIPVGAKAVKRYFIITPNGTGYNANIKLYYKDAEVVGFTNGENSLQLYRWENGGWSLKGGTVNTTENSITLNNVTGFGMWAMGDPTDSPIPVEMVSFRSDVNGSTVSINWMTATETNNYGFYVERALSSADYNNIKWNELSFVRSAGSSTEMRSYSYIDENLKPGTYLYRLRIVDQDGSFDYSQAVTAVVEGPREYALEQNYPNPFNPVTTIAFTLPETSPVTIKIYDALGKEVAVLFTGDKEAGTHELTFNASNIPSGIYYYTMYSNGFSRTNKMLLLK